MFTLEELLSKRNQREALAHFRHKKDGCGEDGMHVSELEEYWQLNQERVLAEIMCGSFEPGVVKTVEIINRKGKRRVISSMNVLDRFISRLLSQKLRRYLEPEFLAGSYAYQENKRVSKALKICRKYLSHVQKSVFEGCLTEAKLKKLQRELQKILVAEEDSVCVSYGFFKICTKRADWESGRAWTYCLSLKRDMRFLGIAQVGV